MKWWEGGIYEVSYLKDMKDGGWKIKRLEYRVLSKADYRPGKSCARPISVPLFSKVYPADPAGPDSLTDNDQELTPSQTLTIDFMLPWGLAGPGQYGCNA